MWLKQYQESYKIHIFIGFCWYHHIAA